MPISHTSPRPTASIDLTHDHGWSTESTHSTSEGVIRYVRCIACGARRVDVHPLGAMPPLALSNEARPQQ